jgi:hypothetical protein
VASSLDVVIGYSSPKEYPSVGLIGYTPTGFSDVQTVAQGSAPINDAALGTGNVFRLGDYFGAAIDPTQTNVVWGVGEYGKGREPVNWGTEIGAMTLVSGAIPNPPPPPAAPAGRAAAYRGRTSQHKPIAFHTSADGHFVIGVDINLADRCARGYTDSFGLSALSRQDTVPIVKDGSFSFVLDSPPDAFLSSGRMTITGRFQAKSVTGMLVSTEHSRHHGSCRSWEGALARGD